jgi:erythromycin esterase-like protein
MYAAINDWIQHEAIPFSMDSAEYFNSAIDRVIASLDDTVKLLGLGEPMHGGEDFLVLRNRLFQRLVEVHGYTAIAIESSFPRSHFMNEYIMGRGPGSYEVVQDTGVSHGFGKLEANRKLVEWMCQYNADPAHAVKLHFYGFDSPTEMYGTDSPRQVLNFVLDYLACVDMKEIQAYRQRIEALLGENAAWENPAALTDPTQAIGMSPAAMQLRAETEELISELYIRRPEWIATSGKSRYLEALQFASAARQLLNYHAALARQTDDRFVRLMDIRDTMMADMLAHIVSREREWGKVLAFAHNSHLKRGRAEWQLGADLHSWWPAGSHLHHMFGQEYVVIGTAVGVSEGNGISQPEPGTLEASLTAAPGPGRFIPTYDGDRLPASTIAALPTRSGSTQNPSYFPLTAQSFTDFNWLCVLDSTEYTPVW